MPPKKLLPLLTLLSIMALSCEVLAPFTSPKEPDILATYHAIQTDQAKPTATITATPKASATPTATGSGDAPKPVPAGDSIFDWPAGSTNLQLQSDAQGHDNLFVQSPAAGGAGGQAFAQAQQNANGTWTKLAPISAGFETLSGLSAVPDASGRLCLFWSGSAFDASGSLAYGLFRNCQQANGAWTPMAAQVARTNTWAAFSAARAPDGSLQAVFASQPFTQTALYYSPLNGQITKALTGTQLSGDQPVLQGRLAIDAHEGYHAAWVESTGGESIEIYSRASTDGGHTWSAPEQLYTGSADNPASLGFYLLADPLGQVHLAWQAKSHIFYRRWSAASGWGDSVALVSDTLNNSLVLAVTKDGLAQAIWDEFGGSTKQVVRRVQSASGVWGAPQIVSPTGSSELALAVDAAGASHIAWHTGNSVRYLVLP